MEALEQFKKHDYVQKLKTHITSESVPQCGQEELVAFLYKQVMIYIWGMYFTYNSQNPI